MSESREFDFIVIGGGSAGYAAARTAHGLGLRVAVVDGAEELGGLCILRGCMPSKTLIESADRSLTLRRAGEFGLRAEVAAPEIRVIRDRKRRLIRDFASYRQGQLQDGRFTLVRGRASLAGEREIAVRPLSGEPGLVLSARAFGIATGSVVNVPPVPGLREAGFWTSDEALDAEALPRSVVVLGGGAIALEMAHYLEAAGCKVSVIQRSSHFLAGLAPECSDVIAAAYRRRAMDVYLGTKLRGVSKSGSLKRVEFEHEGGLRSVEAEEILVVTGRRPNVGGLGLELAGVALAEGKVVVSSTMQTSQPHIFAAGDVCSALDVVHVAIQQGEIAARNARELLGGGVPREAMDYRLRLFGVFSHPQVAFAGATGAELQTAGVPFESASYPFDDHGKSIVMGETEGFVKMTCHRQTGEILGAVCVGPQATELIHEVVVAMHHRATVADFARIPHYHPTLSEIWTYPSEELAELVGAHAARGG
jgi:pyruvate/2-oxoglutarate dehydrogenase complex dihydrolipoamide dehydrogenase (E3) component